MVEVVMAKAFNASVGSDEFEERPPLSDLYDSPPFYPPYFDTSETHYEEGSRALPEPPRADVNLNVPHLHQLWDTPNDFNGHWACGPACCTMVLAYYGLLEPHPITVAQPEPHQSDYGWYLSHVFAHNTHTFDAKAATPNGEAAGLYGAVLDRIGTQWGAHWHSDRGRGIEPVMRIFLPDVGNHVRIKAQPKAAGIFLQRQPAEGAMKESLDQGHPVIVSGRFTFHGKTYDHLIVARGYYRDPTSGELNWIVNDPYGFETDQSFDGSNVVYTFREIQPKWLCLFGGSFVSNGFHTQDRAVCLFDPNTNQPIGEGTLVGGTDKVYIKRLASTTSLHSSTSVQASTHPTVRLFTPDTNLHVGEGSLVGKSDKVYIRQLDVQAEIV